MPRSFLIKRVQKVNTGFFPWNTETLVQGCCHEYEMKNEEEEEERVGENEDLEIEIELDSKDQLKRSASPSDIKVLTPYDTPMSPPRLIISSCCDQEDEHCSAAGQREHDVIIPSPLGYNHAEEALSPVDRSYFHQQHSYLNRYPVAQSYNAASPMKYLPPWAVESAEEVKKHQCEYCLKWFQRSSSLSNHRLIHKNAKTFKCTQCNMSFLRKSDLGKHMVTHSGSKPYQCNVCSKRFSQSSNMLTHQRRHTGVRPYSCQICGKSFYRKVDVRRHASVHREY